VYGINGCDVNGVNGDRISWHGNREHGVGAVIRCHRVEIGRVNVDSACERGVNRVYGYVTGDGVDGAVGRCLNALRERPKSVEAFVVLASGWAGLRIGGAVT